MILNNSIFPKDFIFNKENILNNYKKVKDDLNNLLYNEIDDIKDISEYILDYEEIFKKSYITYKQNERTLSNKEKRFLSKFLSLDYPNSNEIPENFTNEKDYPNAELILKLIFEKQ